MNIADAGPIVVKLGGSSAGAPELEGWLAALADCGRPVVIVPGGGPFADFIREAQTRIGFSDKAAHAMAILAMEQFGHLLADRQPGLNAIREPEDMKAALKARKAVLWLPNPAAVDAPELAASWALTSDSIAAWLCSRIGSSSLLLIKQSDAARPGMTVEQLAANGLLDAALPSMLPPAVELKVAGPAHLATAAQDLKAGRVPGTSVAHAVRKVG